MKEHCYLACSLSSCSVTFSHSPGPAATVDWAGPSTSTGDKGSILRTYIPTGHLTGAAPQLRLPPSTRVKLTAADNSELLLSVAHL